MPNRAPAGQCSREYVAVAGIAVFQEDAGENGRSPSTNGRGAAAPGGDGRSALDVKDNPCSPLASSNQVPEHSASKPAKAANARWLMFSIPIVLTVTDHR